ncbi:MAG: PTS sugar transporter subunit IIC/EAL domain-containing protein [Oscillospiraceae bacterium]|nr:PTS sugar transporter subunit IIC/EAL domain-containing protein [Oscillospiraceae bacterium]
MGNSSGIITAIRRMEELTAVRAVRSGLVNMIPVLIIGAFALILKTFPVAAYQSLISTLADGFFLKLFDLVYSATFGVLSLYMTYSISRSYMKLKNDTGAVNRGAAMASLLAFFILAGAYLPGFGTDSMGPKSMFLAILTGLGASSLYLAVSRFFRDRRKRLFSAGADREFNRMLSTLSPIAAVALIFALFNALVIRAFDVDSFRMLLSRGFLWLFSHGRNGFFKGFFFVLMSSLLWFFGIHGSDTLEGVMETCFTPGLEINRAAVAAGSAPTEVLTKQFFDCFVLMGGCGSTICLLIAILLFSRNRARRGLGLTAAFPMLFNINELMVFGLPIIFNVTMLLPFLLVPLACYSLAYLAISAGWVPMITGAVDWTTPVLLGGYLATGSVAGSALQLVNMAAGVLIYLPFVRRMDRRAEENARRDFGEFQERFRQREQEWAGIRLTEDGSADGEIAKGLCAELRHGLHSQLALAYQPQYHYDGRCLGVEALLRWHHPVHGLLYPPLAVKLAEEGGFLADLEEAVLAQALRDRPAVQERFGRDVKLSVNVTGTTVVTPRYLQFLRQMNASDPFRDKNLCIEVTEQAALGMNDETRNALREVRGMGIALAIDDFSMGQTSLHYLKDSLFDIIKLDGSLVQGLPSNQNCREIIASITRLAASLDMTVLAEYVGTQEQREALHKIGCDCYQGFLYAPALFLDGQDSAAAAK